MFGFIGKLIGAFLLGLMVLLACIFTGGNISGTVTETYDLRDYGSFTGTYSRKDDAVVLKDFLKFFPQELDPSFEDVQYRFATVSEGLAYEITLEFTIPDEQAYSDFIEGIAPESEFIPFPYDEAYLAYWIPGTEFRFDLKSEERYEKEKPLTFLKMDWANVRCVVTNPEEHRLVFECLYVNADIIFASDELRLDHFLNRFDIDAVEFSRYLKELRTGDESPA